MCTDVHRCAQMCSDVQKWVTKVTNSQTPPNCLQTPPDTHTTKNTPHSHTAKAHPHTHTAKNTPALPVPHSQNTKIFHQATSGSERSEAPASTFSLQMKLERPRGICNCPFWINHSSVDYRRAYFRCGHLKQILVNSRFLKRIFVLTSGIKLIVESTISR